ncbi:TonB-dependent siderophore receptor [Pseudoroseomonas wenyumeiae]|uniref:TonB-dependent siderophore receptor n=1 Tax=Teichococcus wenyumeiae TaxID=2478470 RepID=A0A3A9JDM1_9PROT|nr:TonB-dependent siderophore receptor [Pseudoroseomonas wenyumeiae]RKK04632.1 TonB-dependent siderophore receptor [Pseudoroseomonas wenyumeiae]RMI19298.1 TonB-dependent siderophore receptor [Pseudoroseomonas wenyumeiae]
MPHEPNSKALLTHAAGAVVFLGLSIAPAAYAQQTVVPDAAPAAGGSGSTPGVIVLPTVDVVANPAPAGLPAPYAGGQVAKGGSLGLLGTKSVMDSPFSTSSYTSELIEDQQGRTAADTLINDSSVRLTTGSNGFDDSFQIRGFSVSSTDVGLNGLYGLLSSNRAQAQYIERIELLRGPGALINGIAPGGSIGGGINIITKRAGDLPLTRLTPTFMSDGNFGIQADVSRRYGANNEWGVRFNGLYRDGEASIKDGNLRSGLAALGLDYRGERLRWSADAIFQRDDTKNFRPQLTLSPTIAYIPSPPSSRGNWFPGTKLRQQDSTIATRAEYDVTDWMTAYAAVGYRDGWNDQTFPDSRPGGADALGNFRVTNAYYDSFSKTVSGTVGANFRFDTLGVGHTLNIGYSGLQQEAGNAYIASAITYPSNIYNPSPLPPITAPRTDPRRASVTEFSSLALADTLSFFNDRVLLTGGVRFQNVVVNSYSTTTGERTSRYDADATTPVFGLVVKPWQNVSLYTNYAQGLTRGQIVGAGYRNVGEVLAPYKSEQYEAGVRVDWGSITTSASVFQISRPNAIRTGDNDLAYDGEQRNRGLELSAFGEPLPGLRALASVTFLKPELTNPSDPAERGNDAQGVPDRTFSGALDWDVPGVPGLALNGRVIYTSGAYLNTANTLRFDGWTRVDFGARYRTEIGNKPVTLRASLENAFGADYWLTTGNFVTVGSPRTLLVSASFDF